MGHNLQLMELTFHLPPNGQQPPAYTEEPAFPPPAYTYWSTIGNIKYKQIVQLSKYIISYYWVELWRWNLSKCHIWLLNNVNFYSICFRCCVTLYSNCVLSDINVFWRLSKVDGKENYPYIYIMLQTNSSNITWSHGPKEYSFYHHLVDVRYNSCTFV